MNKTLFSLQTAKPLLLASAVALALTACGGSGGSNAPTPDQPSKPIAPESGKKPENNAKPQAQQPKDNGGNAGNGNTGSGNAGGNMTPPKKPDSPKNFAPSPKDPAPAPKDPELKDPGTTLEPAGAFGSGVITYTQYDALPENGGTLVKHSEKLVADAFFNSTDTFEVKKNSVVLKQDLVESIDNTIQQKVELEFPAAGEKKVIEVGKAGSSLKVGVAYRAKKFGYQEAQAFHYYGLVGEKPFGVAYSMGKLASQQTVQQLQGNIVYQGPASFLEKGVKSQNRNVIDPVLESGSAMITLNTAEKTLDAVITLPQRFNKSYTFDKISYKDSSVFERKVGEMVKVKEAGQEQEKEEFVLREAIRGHFYGEQAQHIGGAYYVPEGAGAFITEKQP